MGARPGTQPIPLSHLLLAPSTREVATACQGRTRCVAHLCPRPSAHAPLPLHHPHPTPTPPAPTHTWSSGIPGQAPG